LENESWYGFAYCTEGYLMQENITTGSTDTTSGYKFAATQKKLFAAQEDTAELYNQGYIDTTSIVAPVGADTGSVLKLLSADQMYLMYHNVDGQNVAWNWLCYCLAADPDVTNNGWAYKPLANSSALDANVTFKANKATWRTNLDGKNVQYVGYFNKTANTYKGFTPKGNPIQMVMVSNWFEDRAFSAIAEHIANRSAANNPLPFNDDGMNEAAQQAWKIILQGTSIGHFEDDPENGYPFLTVTPKADLSAADLTAKKGRATAGVKFQGQLLQFEFTLDIDQD